MGFRDRIQAREIPTISLPANIMETLGVADLPPEATSDPEIETNGRETVIKMLTQVPSLDQNFTFKTNKFGGEAYVQSMRTALARARADAARKRKQLKPFKLLLVSIEQCDTYDLVTVVRTTRASLKQKSVYDDIVAQLSHVNGEE